MAETGTSKRAFLVDIIRAVLFGLVALVLGFIGVSLLFSDLGPGETMTSRLITAIVFYLISGFAVSYLNPRFWLVGGVVSWGGVLFGLGGLIRGPTTETLIYLLPSTVPTFTGAYLDEIVGGKRLIGRLTRRLFQRQKTGL